MEFRDPLVMMNEHAPDGLMRAVMAERLSEEHTSQVVFSEMNARYDFGAQIFHKIISRSVLRPLPDPAAKRA